MRNGPTLRRAARALAASLAASSIIAVPALGSAQSPGGESASDAAPAAAASVDQDSRMAWWRDARFGMFIHFGLYAIPAGESGGRTDHGEWIRETARIPVEEYAKLAPRFELAAFDADAWAAMAADAGMGYLVLTSKHHDGFCLFDSAETEWDVMSTPFGRDLCKELAEACERRGIRFCTYHSIMDWHHPDYLPRRQWEAAQRPAGDADFDRFERYLHAQVAEVIERYRPGVMWFDGEWESTWTHERGVRLFDLCRRLAPEMIVNNRVDVHRGGMGGFSASDEAVGDFATPEQEIPARGLPGVDWESCMTMNAHWGWNRADTAWKSTATLLHNLIDVASKGGNYLLNVGPRADGSFPPEAVERLAEIGAWMQVNGEAVRGTTASVLGALPFGRCTVRRGEATSRLYLHVFEWPATRTLALPGLASPVERAYLLADPETALQVSRADTDVVVVLPEAPLDPVATVVVVEVAGTPLVHEAPVITAESSAFVTALPVTLATSMPALEVRYTLDGTDPAPDSPLAVGAIRLTESCRVRARSFHEGAPVSAIVERSFERVTPKPPTLAIPRKDGLRVAHFDVDWSAVPDAHRRFLVARHSTAPTVTLAGTAREREARRFEGFLAVPRDEWVRFALASDDGSKLWIDGELVVDNDGLHGTVEAYGGAALAEGLHAFELVWFNKTGGAELGLRWALPGEPYTELPAGAFRH